MTFNFVLKNWNEMTKEYCLFVFDIKKSSETSILIIAMSVQNRFPSLYLLGMIVESVTATLNSEQDMDKVRILLVFTLHKDADYIKLL